MCGQVRLRSSSWDKGVLLRPLLGSRRLLRARIIRSTMALTHESVLFLLVNKGGKVKKSDFVAEFKSLLECDDPAEKQRNRDLFKTFVNNVAFVKELDGVRCVVLKKIYQHLLDGVQSAERADGDAEIPPAGEQQRPPARGPESEGGEDAGRPSAYSEPSESGEDATEVLSPVQRALQQSTFGDFKVKRMLNFDVQSAKGVHLIPEESIQSKPYALPLRTPPISNSVEVHKPKTDPDDPPGSPTLDNLRSRRRAPSVESSVSSPKLRRALKSMKTSEEPREARNPSVVPLEQSEHQWLVKCATGHWSQVHGLLMQDSQLAEKKDFMSGFTALHWAAKCGKSSMLVTIIDLGKQGGVDVDINSRAHGGYTPLHIAALHNQAYIMTMLVSEYGADTRIRDNCGKRAYHYLHKDVAASVREMLGEPKVQQVQVQDRILHEREELDLLPDLTKGLHSISRFFQPYTPGQKKRHKQRPSFFSQSEDPIEEREDSSGYRHRLISDASM